MLSQLRRAPSGSTRPETLLRDHGGNFGNQTRKGKGMHFLRKTSLLAIGSVMLSPMNPLAHAASPVVDGNNTFACDLYAQLKSVPGNLFFSPYSISTCL